MCLYEEVPHASTCLRMNMSSKLLGEFTQEGERGPFRCPGVDTLCEVRGVWVSGYMEAPWRGLF